MTLASSDITLWVRIYTKELFVYAISKVNQKEIAEDLIQETFLAAYQSYNNFKKDSSEKTWLFSILKHKIADHYRSKYKQSAVKESFDPLKICFDKDGSWNPCHNPHHWDFNEQELLDNDEFNNALKSCYEKLPPKWGLAVQLKYLNEENSEAVCEKLKISVTNFWQMIHRAKVMLRFCLETNWFNKEELN